MRTVRGVRLSFLLVLATACAPLPPPRAVVTVGPGATSPRNAVLALPLVCESVDESLCSPAGYYTEGTGFRLPANGFPEAIDPIVRFKLELAGYTIADARTLRLETADRTETTTSNEQRGIPSEEVTSADVSDSPTVANLEPADRAAAAQSLGLSGELSTTLKISRAEHRIKFEIVVELRALPEGTVLWTARCSDLEEDPLASARLVASCAGDAVLAWRAPHAVIGGVP